MLEWRRGQGGEGDATLIWRVGGTTEGVMWFFIVGGA